MCYNENVEHKAKGVNMKLKQYKFTTLNKMLKQVDAIEQDCKEHGLYCIEDGIKFARSTQTIEEIIGIKLFDGLDPFLSVHYHFDKGTDSHGVTYSEYFRFSLKEQKKAFKKLRELLTNHEENKIEVSLAISWK